MFPMNIKKEEKVLVFDWGDTLMVEYPDEVGPMAEWSRVAPMAGVIVTVPQLSAGVPCYVASNASDSCAEQVKAALARLGLDKYFQGIYTDKELGAKKPSVAFFQSLLTQLGCTAADVIYIGNDYDKDIVPAKEAGLLTVLISGEAGEYTAADVHISTMWDLKAQLLAGEEEL